MTTCQPPESYRKKYPVLHFLCAGCGATERVKDSTIGEASTAIGLVGWVVRLLPGRVNKAVFSYGLACPECAKIREIAA